MTNDSQKFVIKKYVEQGTSNPIVNRLCLQFFEILGTNMIELPDNKIETVKLHCWDCMNDLLKAEESMKAYLEKEDCAIKEIVKGKGVQYQEHAISYDDPTRVLKKHFEEFLIRCVIAIRRTVKLANIMFDQNIDGPPKLKKHLFEDLNIDNHHKEWIEEDSNWMVDLYELRGQVEHQELKMSEFKVLIIKEKTPKIILPDIHKPRALVREYGVDTLQNTFGYCEDMIALLLNLKCSKQAIIIALAEKDRPSHRDFKYIITMSPELQSSFDKQLRDKT